MRRTKLFVNLTAGLELLRYVPAAHLAGAVVELGQQAVTFDRSIVPGQATGSRLLLVDVRTRIWKARSVCRQLWWYFE